jgi:hypothetical protein
MITSLLTEDNINDNTEDNINDNTEGDTNGDNEDNTDNTQTIKQCLVSTELPS